MNQKSILMIAGVVGIVLIGTVAYFAIVNNASNVTSATKAVQQQVPTPAVQQPSQPVVNQQGQQTTIQTSNTDIFDCGAGNETKQCLYEHAADCLPTKGIISYNDPSWDANSKLGVEHRIIGQQNGKCAYDGKIIASGIAIGFNGLSVHCELSNDLLQKVFTKGIFEQTISENCSGSYVDLLKQTVKPATAPATANKQKTITLDSCYQKSGMPKQIKADGTVCASNMTDLGLIEDGVAINGKLPQCCAF